MELFFRHIFYPDQEWLKFFESLATQAAVAYDSYHTFSDLQKVKQNLANTYNAALETWSKSMELTNIESRGHIQRVTSQTLKLAKELGVDENKLPNIERGALLHDIGKLGILDEILLKKGKLTDTEWHEIEKHPVIAKDLLSGVNLLKDAIDIPFCHHENWDGSGYPQGLKGQAIPMSARIFAVVETYDALLSDKPYRKAWKKEKVIEYFIKEKEKKFDPKIVDAFLSTLK
jgi:HD-GYP domain-containing protein (c-di-GMP phosphodiesterase class II)